MSEFSAADFVPLDDFPLLWRWARSTHDPLPSAVLATIRPLTTAAAATLEPEASSRCRPSAADVPALVLSVPKLGADEVREWLQALGVGTDDTVVVSWSAALALLTKWRTFARYWDAFCYPSSDDVSVWAPNGDWTLCYHHDDCFEFKHHGPAI